jgi:hypothetical protein
MRQPSDVRTPGATAPGTPIRCACAIRDGVCGLGFEIDPGPKAGRIASPTGKIMPCISCDADQ